MNSLSFLHFFAESEMKSEISSLSDFTCFILCKRNPYYCLTAEKMPFSQS